MLKPLLPSAALDKLQALCARSEISSGEARLKLMRWGVAAEPARQIIATLQQSRYIDDARFAGAFTRDKARHAMWGLRKIAISLRQKGVDGDTIATALAQITDDEQRQALIHLLEVRTASHPALLADREGRMKLYRFAVTRGFAPDMASAAIRALATRNNDH